MTQKLIDELVKKISSNWQFPKEKPAKSILLIMAGYQGSGKTTALKTLQKDFGFIITSPDEIRHKLFSRNVPFSDEFVKTVNETHAVLIKKVAKMGFSFAVDSIMTPKRIEWLLKCLEEEGVTNYKVVKVLLYAPMDTLIERVKNRPLVESTYKGTVEELEASVKEHGKLDPEAYDLVIDSSIFDQESVANAIKTYLLTQVVKTVQN